MKIAGYDLKEVSEARDNVTALLERVADRLRVPVQQTPTDWARANRVYGPTTGHPGPREPKLSPTLVPLTDAAASGRYTKCVGVTAAQMGKTAGVLDVIGQRLDQRPAPIIYVGPSEGFNRDQFEPRLKEMLEESSSLSSKFLRGKDDKKLSKIVGGVKIRLASAASSTALKSSPAALALVDEYDEMMGNIKGQGAPLELVEARGDTYADFVTLVISTPSRGRCELVKSTISGLEFFEVAGIDQVASPIWREFQQGSRHHCAVHCPYCDDPFVLMSKHLKWDEGAAPEKAKSTAHILCPSCDAKIYERDGERDLKTEVIQSCFFIHPSQTIEAAKAGEQWDGDVYSQWSSGLLSPFVSWGERAKRYVTAKESGDPDKRQTAVNAGFGEIWAEGSGGDMPTWKELLSHRKGYKAGQVTRRAMKLVMGIDVQRDGLWYVTRAFGSRGTSWLVDYGFLHGSTDKDAVWEDLRSLIETPRSGVPVKKAFIDSGFRPDKPKSGNIHRVYRFCREMRHVCVPTKGRSTGGGAPYRLNKIEVKPDGKAAPISVKLAMLDTDFFKTLVHSRILRGLGANGSFYLHRDADETYARQMLSEVRVIEPGSTKAKWEKVYSENHIFDCECLAAAAGYVLNVHKLHDNIWRDWGGGADIDDEPDIDGGDNEEEPDETEIEVVEGDEPEPPAPKAPPKPKKPLRQRRF